jgi:hypothetical protein
MVKKSPALRLRIDIFLAHLLLVMAKAGKSGEPNAEVCFYLGDCCWRLAECDRGKGAIAKARTLQTKAESYLRQSGWWNGGPYGGAMAMPIPKRPTFAAAIGWRHQEGPPDDAA